MKRSSALITACTATFLIILVAATLEYIHKPSSTTPRQIYPPTWTAKENILSALSAAKKANKRVLVVFGGNWCGDCKNLETYFKEKRNEAIIKQSYIIVHVNVGDHGFSNNFDIAKKYGVPLGPGVPAIAVLDSNEHVLFSDNNWPNAMIDYTTQNLYILLNRWRS